MEVKILPTNIRTVKVKLSKRGTKGHHAAITLPPDLIETYKIAHHERIVIAYLCKANQKIEDVVGEK